MTNKTLLHTNPCQAVVGYSESPCLTITPHIVRLYAYVQIDISPGIPFVVYPVPLCDHHKDILNHYGALVFFDLQEQQRYRGFIRFPDTLALKDNTFVVHKGIDISSLMMYSENDDER